MPQSLSAQLSLRPVTQGDLRRLYHFQNDPVANDMADFPARDEAAFMQHWQQNILANDLAVAEGIWLTHDDGSNELVGSVVSWSIQSEVDTQAQFLSQQKHAAFAVQPAPKHVLRMEHYVGYWIGQDYWSQGIATQALALFTDMRVNRPLLAWVAEHNQGSICVLERNGFLPIEPESIGVPSEANMRLFCLT